jgi:hypothetical protein
MKHRMALAFGCLLLTTVLVATAFGQVNTGTIIVQVQDSSGAVVPGTSITLTETATGQSRSGKADAAGSLRVPFLPVGEYNISAQSPGFKKQVMTGIPLEVDQTATVTAVLQPGGVQQTIQVNGETPVLDLSTSTVGQVINNRKVEDLPLNGRDPFALGALAGDTVPVFGQQTNLPFVGGGGRIESNEIEIDG